MKAYIRTRYGGPEVLRLEDVEKPVPDKDQVLVKIMANSVNPADWHIIRGKPFLARFAFGLSGPRYQIPGMDFSGIAEVVGNSVTHVRPGDHVFGEHPGGGVFAEYACVPGKAIAVMPENTGFAEMACLSVAGLTALQALGVHGHLKQGESVLINGSSGGVGHLTVQMARMFGASVTAVCSEGKAGFVKELGADEIIAYDKVDIFSHNGKYDLVIDNHGNLRLQDFRRMGKRGVVVGFTAVRHMISLLMNSAFSRFPLSQFTAKVSSADLDTLASMIKNGKIKVHIDKTFPYTAVPEAVSYIESMHTKGKVAILWETSGRY